MVDSHAVPDPGPELATEVHGRAQPTAPGLPMTEAVVCEIRGCALPATARCDACARPCCPDHLRRVSLERRQETVETPGHRAVLARAPTSTVTFALCPRCGKRPFEGSRHRGTPARG
ncbi:MAG TPA: hypothetical protein VIG30_03020 [Ktedonobacterales bacterium]